MAESNASMARFSQAAARLRYVAGRSSMSEVHSDAQSDAYIYFDEHVLDGKTASPRSVNLMRMTKQPALAQ
jgi:hypothetical protein